MKLKNLIAGAALWAMAAGPVAAYSPAPGSNPIIRDVFTADPAPLVVGDTLYLYTGHYKASGH